MVRLSASEGPAAGRPVELGHGARLGRHPQCDLVAAHPSVSRVHARLVRRGADWLLVDAESRNGLFVGDRRVHEVRLEPGLEVRLGEFALRVVDLDGEPEAAAGAAPLEEDFELDLSGAAPASASAAPGSDDGGLELEDPAEIQVGAPGRAAAEPGGPGAGLSEAQRRSARFLAEESQARSGLVRGELTQQPGWVQGLVYLGVLAFGAAIAYGVSWLVGR